MKSRVDAEHAARFFFGLVVRGVRGVPFLPEELERAQEEPRAHLPAHDVRPLVDEQRQIAIALHPLGEHRVDDRLGRGPNDQRLVELLAAAVRDDGDFGREAFDVLRLLGEEALRDEQREVRVLVARRLEHVVERALHPLPDAVAVGRMTMQPRTGE